MPATTTKSGKAKSIAVPEGYLNITDAAAFLGLAVQSVYDLTSKREIEFEKPHKVLLFKKTALQEHLTKRSARKFTRHQEAAILDIMSRRGQVTKISNITQSEVYDLWTELNKHLKENLALISVHSYKTDAEKLGILTYKFEQLKREERVILIQCKNNIPDTDPIVRLCESESRRLNIHVVLLCEPSKPSK